jgi:DNA-binding LacI/PurR family transcriptional regulator
MIKQQKNTTSTHHSKYSEIERFVRQHAGQRLPGERELTAQFGISRLQVRNILEQLEQKGLVQRRHGSGTYALIQGDNELAHVVLLVDSALKLGDDPFFSLLLDRLQSELQAAGTQCVMLRTEGEGVPLPATDGVIALGGAALSALKSAISTSLPAVGLFAAATAKPRHNLSLLELDDERAGSEAAQRLIAQGVNQAYFFGRRTVPAVAERLAGVERELENANVPLTVVSCGLNYAAGLEQGIAFDAPKTGLTGLIASNDWLAIGLHTGLQSQSPELRRRLFIVSFDGLPLVHRPELDITSLTVPLETMAIDAVAELRRLKCSGSVGRAIRYSLDLK